MEKYFIELDHDLKFSDGRNYRVISEKTNYWVLDTKTMQACHTLIEASDFLSRLVYHQAVKLVMNDYLQSGTIKNYNEQ